MCITDGCGLPPHAAGPPILKTAHQIPVALKKEWESMTFRPATKAFATLAGAGALVTALNIRTLGPAVLNIPPLFTGTRLTSGITYGPQPWQRLDIYRPAGDETRPLPVIVFFYGGRWMEGQKEIYRFAGDAFARRGFAVVIPDYAKYPAVRFPAFVEDGARALAWVSDHIAEHGGDPSRIFVAGHSAGAHIGSLLAADPSWLALEGKNRNAVIRGFAGLAGPYSFTPNEPDLIDIFGPPQRYPAMQATTFIDGTQPPMLLLYGDADTTVKRYNLDRLEARIHEKGGAVKSVIYPGTDHLWILGALGWVGFRGPPVADDVAAFFASLQ
jgi:acetyl esterase/lipase